MLKLLFFIFSILYAKENWFITQYEYGKMLYNNPRGIGCVKCHGIDKKGKIITSYIAIEEKNGIKVPQLKVIKTYPIDNISFETLKKALNHTLKKDDLHPMRKYLNIMPMYDYLTEDEIEALFLYIKDRDGK